MEKILFMNGSPNRNGNTFTIGEEALKNIEHSILQMADYKVSQYGQVYEDDQIKDIFKEIEKADTLVIGAPIYWYTVGGILKTFIDRLYMLPEAEMLKGKKLYVFAQGSAPNKECYDNITYLMKRVATLMDMELKGLAIGADSEKAKIIKELNIK